MGRSPSRQAAGQAPEAAEAGYAAIDALVALTILSMTLALAMAASVTAAKAARTADEARHAGALMQFLIEGTGLASGVADGFIWRAEATVRAAPGPLHDLAICSRRVWVTSAASGRTYELASAALYPAAAGA